MNSYYFVLEVEPQSDNSMIGHVSRAVGHLWVAAAEMDEAREKVLQYLKSEHWSVTEEKKAYVPAPEEIAELKGEDLSNYQEAQTEGFHARFYYWHRAE